MPSPIAHSVSGFAMAWLFPLDKNATRLSKRGLAQLFYGLFIAAAPDLDFIPQLLTGQRYHHGFSHSLIFALGFTLVVWAIGYMAMRGESARLFLLTLMLYGSHLLMDYFTAGGPGIQLLWPFTFVSFKSAIAIFPETHHSKALFQHPGHLVFIAFELGYAALVLGGLLLWNHQQRKWRLSPRRRSLAELVQGYHSHSD